MEFFIRPLRLPDDYAGIAAVWNENLSEPTSAESLQEDDAKLYVQGKLYINGEGLVEGYDRVRRVAVDGEDRVIGYLWTWRAPWTEPGCLNHTLVVSRSYHGLGIGQGLMKEAADWALEVGAGTIFTEVWDDQPRSMLFAQQSGFEIERRSWQSVLELSTGQDAVNPEDASVIERLQNEGIRFISLADVPEEKGELQLYELETATHRDIPGFLGSAPSFEEWRKWYLQGDGYAPERVLIAVDGSRFIGSCNLHYHEDTGGMYHEYTCVHKEYRGRGIALALKVLSIQLAQRTGARYMRTDNDSLNEAMLAVNRRLGYKAMRGRYRIKGEVREIRRERL